jgi:predicted Zn-dependent protease
VGVLVLALMLGAGLAAAPVAPVHAQESDSAAKKSRKKERQNFAAGEWAFKKLSAAHEALAVENFVEATAILNEMAARKGLNKHEQALMWQTFAYVQSSQGEYKAAVKSFEQCIALEAMPEAALLSTQYNLGQLYMSVGRFKDAVTTLEDWLGKVENPAGSAYYLVAMAHVQLQNAKAGLPYARKAVQLAKSPKESWLQLLLALEFELKHYAEVAKVLEVLIEHFPKKSYFLQLSAAYAELGRDERVLSTLELAYMQGLLDRESELLNLAQAYLYREVPFRAAEVLEKGLADKVISEDADNWKLLGDSWLHAREYDKAIAPLASAAALSDDGNLFVRIGQVHLERDETGKARASLEKGIAKGGLDDPGNAYLLLGITHADAKRFDDARKAFTAAGKYEKNRSAAQNWLKHVDRQEAIQ